jgi:hypothetical protein
MGMEKRGKFVKIVAIVTLVIFLATSLGVVTYSIFG